MSLAQKGRRVVLAGLVLVRTFLSWTLVLEIEGRWPWQRKAGGEIGSDRPIAVRPPRSQATG